MLAALVPTLDLQPEQRFIITKASPGQCVRGCIKAFDIHLAPPCPYLRVRPAFFQPGWPFPQYLAMSAVRGFSELPAFRKIITGWYSPAPQCDRVSFSRNLVKRITFFLSRIHASKCFLTNQYQLFGLKFMFRILFHESANIIGNIFSFNQYLEILTRHIQA